jgi:hypothetical protein
MDAKFATTLESQHVHTQVFIDIKSIFLSFYGGKSTQLKLLRWNQLLLLSSNINRLSTI